MSGSHLNSARIMKSASQWTWVMKQFQFANKPNNSSSIKFAPKAVPGLADVGVPYGDGDGP